MSRKSGKRQQLDTEKYFLAFGDVFVMPVFRLSKTLITGRPVKQYQYRRNMVIDIISLTMLVALLVWLGFGQLFGHRLFIFHQIVGIIAGIIFLAFLIGLSIKWLRKLIRRKYTVSDTSNNLEKALMIMDSTAKWYDDEDEANRELVTCLRTLKLDAEYGYNLPNGRTADARVGSGLVEGKLSPDTSEVDRLLGQLKEYIPYGDKLHIVIYGILSDDARRRIENEISQRYLGKVFLIALSNPRRLRAEND
jgi:hypothetical protein